jgi:hypothetical protein
MALYNLEKSASRSTKTAAGSRLILSPIEAILVVIITILEPLSGCPFRKFYPAWIRVVRQNNRIIQADAFDPALARNVRRRLVQVAMPA